MHLTLFCLYDAHSVKPGRLYLNHALQIVPIIISREDVPRTQQKSSIIFHDANREMGTSGRMKEGYYLWVI
jgi:hypothetical protein